MHNLKIITSTVRPGRKGVAIEKWIMEHAKKHGKYTVELLDLSVINLPFMDEPNHPMLKKYEHEHTKKWSASVDEADAFIFVTAEYDNNYPAPLRNAIEYLAHEWEYKAAGIVSYGGISAGTRAANSLKSDLATMKIVPLSEAVHIPFFSQHINEDDIFLADEVSIKAADTMLKELFRWTKGLKIIRDNKNE